MLIKGGSSFNALVRALKQDVVTGAAPTTTASDRLMYEVDKVDFHRGYPVFTSAEQSGPQHSGQTTRCLLHCLDKTRLVFVKGRPCYEVEHCYPGFLVA